VTFGRAIAVLLVGLLIPLAPLASEADATRDSGLVEHATSRLAQIDVTVSGAGRSAEGLRAEDFELKLNDKLVEGLIVDDFCHPPAGDDLPPAEPAPPSSRAGDAAPALAKRTPSTTYLLYFDMGHLTVPGRQDSIDSAREMLPSLLTGGRRAMIVANAAELKTIVPLTSDVKKLDTALAALRNDIHTFDPYAAHESQRMTEILRILADPTLGGTIPALKMARQYAKEERWRQQRDLRRLSMVLGRFAEIDPPKAVLYFADTMRQNAGEHYLAFFGGTQFVNSNGVPVPEADGIQLDAATGALELDRVINDAGAVGVRFYTIEGQGMTGETSPIEARGSAAVGGNGPPPTVNSQHLRDSQGTMVSLAAETGGRAFLNGVTPRRMASDISSDLGCVYLLSFDPRAFRQDQPLAVSVVVKRPGVKVSARGRIVIQSEPVRRTQRILSAFTDPSGGAAPSAKAIHLGVIPISYESGKFKARVQVVVGGSVVPSTTWDVGASLVSRGVVRQDGSGQVQILHPNTPVIFEQDMEFAAGEYDLVAVAREEQTDTVISTEAHRVWPALSTDAPTVGPVAVSQPQAGGFLRNGAKGTQGAVVVAEDQPLRAESPTAVITLVCGAKGSKNRVTATRTLIGETETPVGATEIDFGTQRCAQVLDLIPAKTLGPGSYRYVVSVGANGAELARAERALLVPEVSGTTAKPANPSGGRD
jgi:VWFA-related protein